MSEPAILLQNALSAQMRDRWVPHWQSDPYWRIYTNDESGAELIYEQGRIPLLPGRVLVVPGWLRFHGVLARSLRHNWISFSVPTWSASFCRQRHTRVLVLHEGDRGWDLCYHTLRSVRDAFVASESFPRFPQSQLCRFMASAYHALECYLDRFPAPDVSRPEDLSRLLDYIERHPGSDLRVESLAKVYGCTEAHLSRLFSNKLGQSLSSYVRESRISQAVDLLVKSQDSIEQIAATCGFSNRFHFTRVFTKIMLMGPADYRKHLPRY